MHVFVSTDQMLSHQSKVSRYCHDHTPKPQPWKREKQDLSGHVCFDNELYEFYRTSELRANRIERARLDGTLVIQQSRNPLRAEKTPRKEFYMKAPPSLSTAKIPDILSRGDEDAHNVSSNQGKFNQTLSTLPTAHKESKLSEDVERNIPLPRVEEVVLHNRPSRAAPAVDVKKIEYELLNSSITEFRKKVNEDPLLLAKWRAEKAAEYISKHGVTVPEPSRDDREAYLLYGRSSAKRPVKKGQLKKQTMTIENRIAKGSFSENVSKGEVLQNINYLRQKLVDTEREIERQELRLALHSGTKHYEMPVGRLRRGSSS